MRRREFITLFGGAKQVPRRPIIAVLSPIWAAAATRNIEALRVGLLELGHVEDRDITIELRFAEGAMTHPCRQPRLLPLTPLRT
jgi:hypothetical protein